MVSDLIQWKCKRTILFIVSILIVIATLAFYDAYNDAYDIITCVICAIILIFVLSIMNWIAIEVTIKKNRFSFTLGGAMAINCFALIAYYFYATDGQPDVNTAAHMRFIAFPALLLIASVILFLPLLIIDFTTGRK